MNLLTLPCAMAVTAMLLSGCAKKPVAAVTSAPAPTGASAPTGTVPAPPRPSAAAVRPSGPAPSTELSTRRPAPGEFVAVEDLRDIYFDFDAYAIRSEDAHILRGHARWLTANPNALLLIEGHCDERGTIDYNVALGERRATAAKHYLAAHGVSPARITIVSYGEEKPQCTAHEERCWAKNRRANFLVKTE